MTLERAAPRSGLAADAAALHEALAELVRVYQFRDRDRICCHDISVTQCYALEALIRRGPCGLNELAADLYLDKSTASRVVATLERKRYVTRAPHPTDKRAVVLRVTAAGRRLHDLIRTDLIGEARDLLQDFEPEVRAGAARLILRLARAAARRSGVPAGAGCCPPAGCQ
ncbi:MAG TPA: MarR family transcriptional regulator [Vicinamibacteria bacterium]|nr:MarR family transcriptional regulator [Vicinamibacteria bacterium]